MRGAAPRCPGALWGLFAFFRLLAGNLAARGSIHGWRRHADECPDGLVDAYHGIRALGLPHICETLTAFSIEVNLKPRVFSSISIFHGGGRPWPPVEMFK